MDDKKEAQLELDTENSEDTEVELEQPEEILEAETEKPVEDPLEEDPFKKAESATQKRIDRLTKKMREAERREQEALKYAEAVQQEANNLKNRVQALDTNYVSEYSSRVASEMAQAEAELSRAIEMGDSKKTVEAQRKLTSLAIQADRAEQAKLNQQRTQESLKETSKNLEVKQTPAQQPKRPDPKAEEWALRNSWFGQDEAMTYAAFGIHKRLVETEGFDPQSDEYYTELDQRIAEKFKLDSKKTTSSRPAQTVAGATRTNSGRSGKKVRLTPSQVAIAKKLGVPLEEYAKYVKE